MAAVKKTKEEKLKALERRGVETGIDMCYFAPYKFYDFTTVKERSMENVGKFVCITGELVNMKKTSSNGRTNITLKVDTSLGRLNVIYIGSSFMWSIAESLMNQQVWVYGKLQYSPEYDSYSIMNPEDFSPYPKLYVKKTYSKVSGVGEKFLADRIEESLESAPLKETLPERIRKDKNFPDRKEALKILHYSDNMHDIKRALNRFVFEDLLYFACEVEQNNRKLSKGSQYNLKTYGSVRKVTDSLPYELTADQQATVNDIFEKMKAGIRVSALVQGDVGCGKSIVAFLTMLAMADSGYQSVIMAPTVVLAEQHFNELKKYADLCGYKVAFLGGKQTAKEKRLLKEGIKSGEYQLIVGTHAILSDTVEFKDLALCVTDEEHKFGVKQREALMKKAANGVHTISFSATPLPRTITDVLYSDVTVYQIKTMPKGRKPVQTAIAGNDICIFNHVRRELDRGSQIYVVCPLVDDEDEEKPLRNVAQVAKMYEQQLNVKVGTVTGKTKAEEVADTLARFKSGEIKVLVATTVIEVGVNVPNATTIVIEDAWMFGLAGLHQLRGRVGRGDKQGYCVLHSDRECERLQILCDTTDGFEIAEKDRQLRGTGNVISVEQSGNNHYMEEIMMYPSLYDNAREYARKMVDYGEDVILKKETERRNEKIYISAKKVKIYG